MVSMGKLLAKTWGIPYASVAYYARVREMRLQYKPSNRKVTLAPAGPVCLDCGGNSYICECSRKERL